MPDVHELRRTSRNLKSQAQQILDDAGARTLTVEEEASFDRLMDEADGLDDRIGREERAREARRRDADTDDRPTDPNPDDQPDDEDDAPAERTRAEAFRAYVLGGRQALTDAQRAALNASNDPEGGFLVAPQQWVQTLLQRVDDDVPFRALATRYTLRQSESLGVPSLDNDLNDADWTSELGTGTQDDAIRIGKRELRPHPLAKRVRISRKLLRAAAMDPESLVRDRMAYKFAVTVEKAYMTGDGNEKPLGIFTASNQGISTGRDATLGAGGAIPLTAATADQLIDAKYALKAGYWRNARWLFHRDLLRTIRKLKDGQSQYIWQAGLTGDRPDTILEVPYVVSEFCPNTITGSAYVGMIGDFANYWIADALDMEVQRLVELYAETNQVGFIGRQETDGMPVIEEAFVRLKVAA